MYNYNYHEQVRADIYMMLEENFYEYFEGVTAEDVKRDPYEVADRIADDLFNSDSVTGNASGSYFCNSYSAMEAVIDNIPLLREAVDSWSLENELIDWFLEERWEDMDVTIRCYVLHECACEVMEDIKSELEEIEASADAREIAQKLAA